MAEVHDYIDRRTRDADGKPVARQVRRVRIKGHDKLKALELLARHHGLLQGKSEPSISADIAGQLHAARCRALQAQKRHEADSHAPPSGGEP